MDNDEFHYIVDFDAFYDHLNDECGNAFAGAIFRQHTHDEVATICRCYDCGMVVISGRNRLVRDSGPSELDGPDIPIQFSGLEPLEAHYRWKKLINNHEETLTMAVTLHDGNFLIYEGIGDLIAANKIVKDEEPPPDPAPRTKEFRSIDLRD